MDSTTTFCPKEWISNLLTENQLLERNTTDPKYFMNFLKSDLAIAVPIDVDEATEALHDDFKYCWRMIQRKYTLKGEKIYAYYRISNYIRARRDLRYKALEIKAEI